MYPFGIEVEMANVLQLVMGLVASIAWMMSMFYGRCRA